MSASIICVPVPLPVAGPLVGAVPPAHLGSAVAARALAQAVAPTSAFPRLSTPLPGAYHVLSP